ncbi:MAG: DUF3822 family protein [Flavobacteriaceae bacterium]
MSKRKLSIQFSLDGFSFCISNFNDETYQFTSYTFEEKSNSPEAILENLKDIFKKDASLQDDFETVQVIHQNNLNSFVPTTYFKEDALKSYLKFNIRTITTDLIVYDDLEELDCKNVYIPYVNINNFLFQNFGEFEYKHHSTLLVQKLVSVSNANSSFYIHVNESFFDIVVINEQKLTFYNSFEFTSKEDFIYYTLFTLEQLKIDPDTIQVTLLGDINDQSELYQIAYKYIRNCHFLKVDTSIVDAEKGLYQHSNFILLG